MLCCLLTNDFKSENFVRALIEIILDVDISKQRYILYNFHRALIEIELKLYNIVKNREGIGKGRLRNAKIENVVES